MIEKNKKLESSIRTNKIILERLENKLNDSIATATFGEAAEGGTNTAIKVQIECIKKKIQKKELKIENLKKGGDLKGVDCRAAALRVDRESARCSAVERRPASERPKPVSGKVVVKKGVPVTRCDTALPEEINKNVRNRNFKQNYYKNNNIIEKTKRYIDSFYDEYLKIEETIPDYMIKNLEKMPNNKGYIWRGIRLYGKLTVPNSSNAKTVYLDERKHGEMFIHEITPVVENLYKKNGNGYGKHQLVSNTVRKIKKHTPSK